MPWQKKSQANKKMCSFSSWVPCTTDNLYETHVFHVKRDTRPMETGEVCIFEQLNQIRLRRFTQTFQCITLDAIIIFVDLHHLTYDTSIPIKRRRNRKNQMNIFVLSIRPVVYTSKYFVVIHTVGMEVLESIVWYRFDILLFLWLYDLFAFSASAVCVMSDVGLFAAALCHFHQTMFDFGIAPLHHRRRRHHLLLNKINKNNRKFSCNQFNRLRYLLVRCSYLLVRPLVLHQIVLVKKSTVKKEINRIIQNSKGVYQL